MPLIVGRTGSNVAPPASETDKEEAMIQRIIEDMAARSGVTDAAQLGYILGGMHAQQLRLASGGGSE